MKTSNLNVLGSIIVASIFLMTACGGDGGSDRRLPGGQLNLKPDQIDIITPAHNAQNICRFNDIIVRIKDDPNCDSATVYENVGEYMEVSRADSVGSTAEALTQGYASPSAEGCLITFRTKSRTTSLTEYVARVKGTPAGSIGTNKQSAKYKTGDAGNSSCGDEAFFELTQVIVGGRAYAQNNGGMSSFETPVENLVGEDANGAFTFNTSNLGQNVASMAVNLGAGILLGLGTVSQSALTKVEFNAEIDEYSTQYGIRLYQVPNIGSNLLGFLLPLNWTPVNLDSGCAANSQFGNNSCAYYQAGSKQTILINSQLAGYVPGTGYVLMISRGMTSPSGRVLKHTYMVPFVVQ